MTKQPINHLGIDNPCSSSGGTVINYQSPPTDGGFHAAEEGYKLPAPPADGGFQAAEEW
jgi:hypothetical protein